MVKQFFFGFKIGVSGTKTRYRIGQCVEDCVMVGISPQDQVEMKIDVRKTCATINMIGTLLSTRPNSMRLVYACVATVM